MSELLVVEDDEQLRRALAITLRARGYVVHAVGTGSQALSHVFAGRRPDVLVLDLGLPDLDGVEVIRRLREHSAIPVVVLSARRDQSDKVSALDAGADDYLTKPFGIEELLARLRAAERRGAAPRGRAVITTPDFTVDLGRKEVRRPDGDVVHLTPTEWEVLEVLIRADGMLVPGSELLREVWGPQAVSQGNYLRVYVAQLRGKLEPDPPRPRYLLTSPGLGYRFDGGRSDAV